MLVVADQESVRCRGERRLAGAGQPEEDGDVPLRRGVGRAVHRHHVLLRQQVVEHGEDRLLDLPCVAGAADDDELPREVDDDEGFGIGAVDLRLGVEGGKVDDGELGPVVAEFFRSGAQEHVACEQGVPGPLADDAHRNPVHGACAGEAVLHEEVATLHVVAHLLVKRVEAFRFEGAVHLAPVDEVAARRLLDDELVVRRPPGVVTGFYGEGSQVGDEPLAAPDHLLVKDRGGGGPVDEVRVGDAVFFQSIASGYVV